MEVRGERLEGKGKGSGCRIKMHTSLVSMVFLVCLVIEQKKLKIYTKETTSVHS